MYSIDSRTSISATNPAQFSIHVLLYILDGGVLYIHTYRLTTESPGPFFFFLSSSFLYLFVCFFFQFRFHRVLIQLILSFFVLDSFASFLLL